MEWLDYFKSGKAETSWIASILVGVTLCSGKCVCWVNNESKELLNFNSIGTQMKLIATCSFHHVGPISSGFVNKYGCRAVTIAGTVIAGGNFLAIN